MQRNILFHYVCVCVYMQVSYIKEINSLRQRLKKKYKKSKKKKNLGLWMRGLKQSLREIMTG